MSNPFRLLILTAAFGEGHNTAARNLALALGEGGAAVRVCDPCLEATPLSTRALERLYRFGTDHLPLGWKAAYELVDRFDLSRMGAVFTRDAERWLAAAVAEFQPAAVVSAYPLYPYLLERIFMKTGRRVPVFTVITDSMEINRSWLRPHSDFLLVTDSGSRDKLLAEGFPPEKVLDTGFAVSPVFAGLRPLGADDPCAPFRVLFFPTACRRGLEPMAAALLEASPAVRLTLALGKNLRRLGPQALRVQRARPGRVRLRGWTRRVPFLLENHHLVVGKAGGATVHEAIAATCPMLIHHLVPGQEEGNLALLRALGAGNLARRPAELAGQVAAMLEDSAAGWRAMKQALTRHNRKSGAAAAARFILDTLRSQAP